MGPAFNAALLEDWAPEGIASLNEEYKMVIVMNAALGMSPGKIGAQTAHAAVSVVRLCAEEDNPGYNRMLQKWTADGSASFF